MERTQIQFWTIICDNKTSKTALIEIIIKKKYTYTSKNLSKIENKYTNKVYISFAIEQKSNKVIEHIIINNIRDNGFLLVNFIIIL